MEQTQRNLISPVPEVPVLEDEVVTAVRGLRERGGQGDPTRAGGGPQYGATVCAGAPVDVQQRPASRRLTTTQVTAAQDLFSGAAEGNAVMVQQLLAAEGCQASVRTVQRVVAPVRQPARAADVATVRVETAPGAQLQVDFGEKRLEIAGRLVTIFLLVAILSYSRRIFVKAFLHERQDDWREGIAAAFVHFGGVPQTILGDNARALVLGRDRQTGTVTFIPPIAFAANRLRFIDSVLTYRRSATAHSSSCSSRIAPTSRRTRLRADSCCGVGADARGAADAGRPGCLWLRPRGARRPSGSGCAAPPRSSAAARAPRQNRGEDGTDDCRDRS
jgi:hypothetical protein